MKLFSHFKYTTQTKPVYSSALMFALLLCAYFFSYFFRITTSVVLPILAPVWGISSSTIGIISSLFFYTYGIGVLFGGALNDRFGPMRVVAAGCAVAGIGSLLSAFAPNALVFSLGRIMNGLGMAPALSGTLVYISYKYSKEKYALLSGITYTVGYFGSAVSVAPLSAAVDSFGVTPSFTVLSVLVLLIMVLLLLFRNQDPVVIHSAVTVGNPLHGVFKQIKESLIIIGTSVQYRAMVVLWSVSFGVLMTFQGLWAPSWYQIVFDSPGYQAKWWATLIGVGVMAGSFLGNSFCKSSKNRKQTIVTFSIIYCLLYIVLMMVMVFKISLSLAGIIGFLIGFAGGVQYLHLTAGLNDIAPRGRNATLFGTITLFTFVAVIIFQTASGTVMDYIKDSTGAGFTPFGFNFTFGIITVIISISLATLLFLEPFDKDAEHK